MKEKRWCLVLISLRNEDKLDVNWLNKQYYMTKGRDVNKRMVYRFVRLNKWVEEAAKIAKGREERLKGN